MKNAVSRITFALTTLALGSLLSSCATTPAATGEEQRSETAIASEQDGENLRYRPVNGNWTGHWTPERSHAEDHLRAHNARNGVAGGVVEYQ